MKGKFTTCKWSSTKKQNKKTSIVLNIRMGGCAYFIHLDMRENGKSRQRFSLAKSWQIKTKMPSFVQIYRVCSFFIARGRGNMKLMMLIIQIGAELRVCICLGKKSTSESWNSPTEHHAHCPLFPKDLIFSWSCIEKKKEKKIQFVLIDVNDFRFTCRGIINILLSATT